MPLSNDVLQWVIHSVNKEAKVQSNVCLKGSTSSTLYHLTLSIENEQKDVVLRLFDRKDWVKEEPDLARHEAESLKNAEKIIVPTPKMINFDEKGTICGQPLILMSQLAGEVVLNPKDFYLWINELAWALRAVHKREVDAFSWEYFTYEDVSTFEVPSWTTVPDDWQRALKIVQGPRPNFIPRFIHRDYHPANVLFKEGRVSGIVDWVNACLGPVGIDVGHCRVNLALLYDVQAADQFLSAYKREAGNHFTYDPYWDILSVFDILADRMTVYPGWVAFGVTGLTNEMMEERLDVYVKSLVKRL